jgi:putative phosphoribosyl transferase
MFKDPSEGGVRLARWLRAYRPFSPVVIALDQAGAAVAEPIAHALDTSLDLIITHPICANEDAITIGAVALGGGVSYEEHTVVALGWGPAQLDQAIARARSRLGALNQGLRQGRPFPDVEGRIVVLVSDGIGTIHERVAALRSLRDRQPRWLVLALPFCTPPMSRLLVSECDSVATLATHEPSGPTYEDVHRVIGG